MTCRRICLVALPILSFFVVLVGVILVGTAMFQPFWQRANFNGVDGIESVYFGLYENCKSKNGKWVCYKKWEEKHIDEVPISIGKNSSFDWRIATFAALTLADICGAVALVMGICNRFIFPAKHLLTFFAGSMSGAAVVLFFMKAKDETYTYNIYTFKASFGETFYLAAIGAIAFALSSLLSLISATLFNREMKQMATESTGLIKHHESRL